MLDTTYVPPKPGDPNWIDPEKTRSISFGGGIGNRRREQVSTVVDTEKRWAKDFDAYRRLRADGLQPGRADGSAKLEATATSREQIEAT
jgi:hypothetical protein